MNCDGWGQMGAGQDDMRIAGEDLQHYNQKSSSSTGRTHPGSGGPMKEALDQEMSRHKEAKSMRIDHLERHYKR